MSGGGRGCSPLGAVGLLHDGDDVSSVSAACWKGVSSSVSGLVMVDARMPESSRVCQLFSTAWAGAAHRVLLVACWGFDGNGNVLSLSSINKTATTRSSCHSCIAIQSPTNKHSAQPCATTRRIGHPSPRTATNNHTPPTVPQRTRSNAYTYFTSCQGCSYTQLSDPF